MRFVKNKVDLVRSTKSHFATMQTLNTKQIPINSPEAAPHDNISLHFGSPV